jgi:hypothetical protein
LQNPEGVFVDGSGNIYIADESNNRIRKVDTNGIITTVAGSGNTLFFGDGGPATDAGLYWPTGVFVDGSGNIYIADRLNNRIRMVNSNGIIATVAGNGSKGFSGDGGPATDASLSSPHNIVVDAAGNIFIADFSNNRIRKVDANGIISTVAGDGIEGFSGDGGPATDASLNSPEGLFGQTIQHIYQISSA